MKRVLPRAAAFAVTPRYHKNLAEKRPEKREPDLSIYSCRLAEHQDLPLFMQFL